MKKLLLIVMFTVTTALVYADTTSNTGNTVTWKGENIEGPIWILVWAPIIIFLVSVIVINSRTKKFKLEDALTENQYPLITEINPLYIAPAAALPPSVTPTINVSDTANGLPKSSTRYLALLTTTLTLIIAVCLSSTYIYIYLKSGTSPSFDKLGDILLALGIGVTPYAFNKVSTAVSGKNP